MSMLKASIESGFAGFIVGIVMGFITIGITLDLKDFPADKMQAAEAICKEINSTLESADYYTATCTNRAEIPYTVRK